VRASAHGWSLPSAIDTNSRARATYRGCPGTVRVAQSGRAVTGGPSSWPNFQDLLNSVLDA
jgi:hypothetical protein